MTEFNNYKLLCDMVDVLESVNASETNRVSSIRKLVAQINNAKDALVKAVQKSFKTVADAVNVQQKATDKLTAKITGAKAPIVNKSASGPKRTVTLAFTNVPATTSLLTSGDQGATAKGAMQNMSSMVKK